MRDRIHAPVIVLVLGDERLRGAEMFSQLFLTDARGITQPRQALPKGLHCAANDCALVEVPRSDRQIAEQLREIGQALRDHVQHVPLALQFPAHQE